VSIADVAAQLDAVLDEIDAVRVSLGAAADLIDEVAAIVETAVAGSAAPEALDALSLFEQARQGLEAPSGMLHIAEEAIRDYRAYLVGQTSSVDPPATTSNPKAEQARPPEAPSAKPIAVTPERIEQLRRELPPPVVPGTGQKTHGRWIDPDGNVHAEVSGEDEKSEDAIWFFEEEIKSRRTPTVVTDVETKLAVHMRKRHIRSAVLVINNIPCSGAMGCAEIVPVVLPPGYTMTVYGSDGVPREYKGGGTSEWVP
jgi:hypothetical protein